MNKVRILGLMVLVLWGVLSCEKDDIGPHAFLVEGKDGPTPYFLQIPPQFNDYTLEEDNPLTVEGIELGRYLFYDPILSRENNISCASCHKQENAFADTSRLSPGTHGERSAFNSMALFNLAWQPRFFWNGRSPTMEAQALQPVINPLEMDLTWPEAVARLQAHPDYPARFKAAFGTEIIDSMLVVKAIAQFERLIVSSESKFDQYLRNGKDASVFSQLEQEGLYTFGLDDGAGHCEHCHNPDLPHVSDFSMANNGLDDDADLKPGYFEVTGKESDYGKFKVPSLRNVALTAPYMHDGRFRTLEEVIDFYSTGVHNNRTLDPRMPLAASQYQNQQINLSEEQKKAIIAFLKTMTDSSLITNPALSNPFR